MTAKGTCLQYLSHDCQHHFETQEKFSVIFVRTQCDQKNSPNVYKSYPKIISLQMIDFDTFTKIAKQCGRFGQINCCQRL